MCKLRRFIGSAIVLVSAGLFLAACGGVDDGPFGEKERVYGVSRDVDVVQARREAIELELQLHDLLTREFGAGQWEPAEKNPQADSSASIYCRDGYHSERWVLASAGAIGDERWLEAVDRVYEFLEPLGFGKAQLWTPRKEHKIAFYINEKTGAKVRLGYWNATTVMIDTGCARGGFFERWPEGTEAVPEHLRTTGRALIDKPLDDWPSTAPSGDVSPSS